MKAVYLPREKAFLRYIEIPGDGPPLLWLHGWQCSSTAELLGAAVQPALKWRRSLLIDFLGHGYSDKPRDFEYTREAHARTIVALIDTLQIDACTLVGHSMGGGVAIHVAAARPDVVAALILAEGSIDPGDEDPFGGMTEAEFVTAGFAELIAAQTSEALAAPEGIRAAHVEMTRLVEPLALYREGLPSSRRTNPSTRSLLAALPIPRTYLVGELSDPEDLEADMASIGVGWNVVPRAGHPMALQNPAGFADTIAAALAAQAEI